MTAGISEELLEAERLTSRRRGSMRWEDLLPIPSLELQEFTLFVAEVEILSSVP